MYVTKQELLEAMDDQDALFFADFLSSTDPDAVKLRVLWDSVDTLNVNSSLIQGYIIPLLLSRNIVTQVTVDNINALGVRSF